MNLYALPSIAAALSCFGVGVAVWARRSQPEASRAFLAYALTFAVTYFVKSNHIQAADLDTARPWVVAGGAVWLLVVPTLWRLIAAFTERHRLVRHPLAILWFDLGAVTFAVLAVLVEPFRRIPHEYDWGFGHAHEPTLGPYGLVLVWLAVSAVVFIAVAFRFSRTRVDPRRHRQAVIGLASGLFLLLAWAFFKRLLPSLGLNTQWLSPIGVVGQISILGYAIWKFDMFELSSPHVAEDVLRKMTEGVVLVDAQHRVVEANPAAEQILGYPHDALTGKHIAEVLVGFDDGEESADDETKTAAPIGVPGSPRKRREQLKSVTGLTFTCRTRQGEEIPVALSTVRLGQKSWAHTVFVLSDLSRLLQRTEQLETANASLRREVMERQRAEQALELRDAQLRQAQKMEAIGRLAGGVAHDFNNMLTVIRGFAHIVSEDVGDRPELRKDLTEITAACDRSAALVRQLLAFSRRQVLRPVATDLNEQVRDLAKMLGRLLGDDVELTTKYHPRLPTVEVDKAQFAQVLMNLAVNARDAMSAGGRLVITTDVHEVVPDRPASSSSLKLGIYAVIRVSDDGTGMSPEVVEQIFEPFFTTKQAGVGTGLGLSTVYGIVKQSGGDIRVQSQPGRGTTFTIYLPECLEGAPRSMGRRASGGTRPGQETILLAEDEEPLRRLTKRILQSNGYRVVEAATAEAALHMVRSHDGSIDLLITDVVMPNMNGFELAQELRKTLPDLPVIYVTGYSYDELGFRGLHAEEVNVLDKPFSPNDLLARVREALETAGPAPD